MSSGNTSLSLTPTFNSGVTNYSTTAERSGSDLAFSVIAKGYDDNAIRVRYRRPDSTNPSAWNTTPMINSKGESMFVYRFSNAESSYILEVETYNATSSTVYTIMMNVE